MQLVRTERRQERWQLAAQKSATCDWSTDAAKTEYWSSWTDEGGNEQPFRCLTWGQACERTKWTSVIYYSALLRNAAGNNVVQVGNLSWVIDFIPYKLSLKTLIILTELDGCFYSIQINELDSETTNVDLNNNIHVYVMLHVHIKLYV